MSTPKPQKQVASQQGTPLALFNHQPEKADIFNTPLTGSKTNTVMKLSRTVDCTGTGRHPNDCLCKDCTCGRHLCKLESPPLSFSLTSSYKSHYPPRKPYRHQHSRPASARLPQSPLLTAKSTYLDDYVEIVGDPLQRPKPEDLMKCKGGPGANLTSYIADYPGHRGKNQYVPVNPEQARGGLKFGSNSTYSQEYQKPRGHSSENAKPADQFRMTGSWLGNSSYKDQFQSPRKESKRMKEDRLALSQCSQRSQSSSYVKERNTSCHFKTTYGCDFLGNKDVTCPAAKKARQAQQELAKSTFKENSHFRGMDSHYTSLSRYANQF